MKTCVKCSFSYDSRRKDLCEYCYQHDYYLKNKERIKARTDAFRRSHMDRHREYNKKYRKNNPDVGAKYYKRTKPVFLAKLKSYRHENRDLVNNQQRIRYATNPDVRKVVLHCAQNNYARRKGAEGSYTIEEWLRVLHISNGICPRCQKNVGLNVMTKDHIVPIIRKGSNYIHNIQPLCGSCNRSKGDDVILYWPERRKAMQNIFEFATKTGMDVVDNGCHVEVLT